MTFDEWYYEPEGFGARFERFYSDLDMYAMDMVDTGRIKQWLKAAYEVGYDHRNSELMDDGK